MKPHIHMPAVPSAGLLPPGPLQLGSAPPTVLGGITSVRVRTSADIIAPGHFFSTTRCAGATVAAMA